LNGSGIRAALREQKRQQILKDVRIRGVAQVGSFAPDMDQVLDFEFFQVMGNGGGLHRQFVPDLACHHPLGMGPQEVMHDPETRFRPKRGQDAGEFDKINGMRLWGHG